MNNDDKYHLALGRFVDAFSTAEHNLKFALAAVANIPRDTAKAIFSGVRVSVSISFIRRIYESRTQDIPQDINDALSHMNTILTERDQIMHYGGNFDGETLVTSTAPHTIHKKAIIKRRSLDDIDNMTKDLLTLGNMFMWIIIKDNPNSFREAIDFLHQSGHVPFQYKPR